MSRQRGPGRKESHRDSGAHPHNDATGTTSGPAWRRRKTQVFVVVTVWLCVAIAVVFFRGLGQAERSGAAEQIAAQYQQDLGSGWFGLEVDPLAPIPPSTEPGWLGLNYSSGTVSTVRPPHSWSAVRLRLAPIGCTTKQPLSIAVRQGATELGSLTPGAGWRWYTIRLTRRAQPITLHYSCVTVQQAPGRGLQSARRLAVLLSGVEG
jgi:hypothetical protein